jgi:hypothetical protein
MFILDGCLIRVRSIVFVFIALFKSAPWFTQPCFEIDNKGVKYPERDSKHSCPFNAVAKNAWSFTSTSYSCLKQWTYPGPGKEGLTVFTALDCPCVSGG